MTIALTDGQRDFLLSTALGNEEYDIRSGESDQPLKEFGERVLSVARLFEFANERAPLHDADRAALVAILTKHRQEAIEAADHDENVALPRLEAGDESYVYCGYSQQESVAKLKEYVARERGEAEYCDEILGRLAASEAVTA